MLRGPDYAEPEMGGDYECPSNNCGEWLEFETQRSRVKCKGCGRTYELEADMRTDAFGAEYPGLEPVEAREAP